MKTLYDFEEVFDTFMIKARNELPPEHLEKLLDWMSMSIKHYEYVISGNSESYVSEGPKKNETRNK